MVRHVGDLLGDWHFRFSRYTLADCLAGYGPDRISVSATLSICDIASSNGNESTGYGHGLVFLGLFAAALLTSERIYELMFGRLVHLVMMVAWIPVYEW